MAESQNQESPKLRTPNRFITDYDASGLAVFNTSIPDPLPAQVIGNMGFHLGYATTSIPADFTNQSDIATYSSFLSTPPGIVIPGGSVLRIVDIGAGGETPMHRTLSLDYGVVLEGEIELVLASGESRVMKRGDISVQRATNHKWRNRSQTEWGRMLFVSQEAKPVNVNGKILGEDYSYGMENVEPSGN
jgi:hypothetical protein